METIPVYCVHGHPNSPVPGARFCIVCGAPLAAPAAPPPPPDAPGRSPAGIPAPSPAVFPVQPAVPAPPVHLPAPPGSHVPPPPGAPAVWPPPQPQAPQVKVCGTCGGGGAKLPGADLVCPECRWLRPLVDGYKLDCTAFQWAQDGAAMARLRSIGPLNAAARAISDKVGRKWIESTFNAVHLGPRQLPGIYNLSVYAARLLGMPTMPDVYVSGDRTWESVTYGSDKSSFIVLGSALLTNYRGRDMLFLLAREMGHCRAGHALWKTVIRFLVGEQGPRKGMLAGGVLSALNPAKLVEGAIELPLLAWARQAEITADRAGLLAVGDEELVRRVMLSWGLKSLALFRQVNVPAWMEQEEDSEDQVLKLTELFSSPTPYITRRLKLMALFARSPELAQWREFIGRIAPAAPLAPATAGPSTRPSSPASNRVAGQPPAPAVPGAAPSRPPVPSGSAAVPAQPGATPPPVRLNCPSCKTVMRVPAQALAGKQTANVRCPNRACGKIVTLKRNPIPAPAPPPPSPRRGRGVEGDDD